MGRIEDVEARESVDEQGRRQAYHVATTKPAPGPAVYVEGGRLLGFLVGVNVVDGRSHAVLTLKPQPAILEHVGEAIAAHRQECEAADAASAVWNHWQLRGSPDWPAHGTPPIRMEVVDRGMYLVRLAIGRGEPVSVGAAAAASMVREELERAGESHASVARLVRSMLWSTGFHDVSPKEWSESDA